MRPLKLGPIFQIEVNHSFFSFFFFFLEGIPLGNSEADRQLLEAAKAGDVETVKVRHDLMVFLTLGFYFDSVSWIRTVKMKKSSYLYVHCFKR